MCRGSRGETGRKHQAKLSGRAKDTVTRSAVMILVSDHTYTPPRRDPICIQPPLQPPAPRITSNGSKQPWHGRPRQTWPASVHCTGHCSDFQESAAAAGQRLPEPFQVIARAQFFRTLLSVKFRPERHDHTSSDAAGCINIIHFHHLGSELSDCGCIQIISIKLPLVTVCSHV